VAALHAWVLSHPWCQHKPMMTYPISLPPSTRKKTHAHEESAKLLHAIQFKTTSKKSNINSELD